ncbi:MAG: YbjN domain-containing protein [Actinobacteria bacterium]|nr:YbjN domain-containing protein [Actinomycetota bacterium]
MAMNIERLRALCEGEGLKYFLAPDRPMVMMGFGGLHGHYQAVVPLELDGRFLQVRTVGYLHCPADHPHIGKVLAVLGHLNYQLRMTKFGWDPSDGEIAAYADVWLEDGDLTQKQFSALFKSLLPSIDLNYKRLTQTIESGEDPGEITPESVAADTLPSKLRGLLDKMKSPKDDDEDDGFGKV